MIKTIKKALIAVMAVPLLSLGVGGAVLVTNAAAAPGGSADCQDSTSVDSTNPDSIGGSGSVKGPGDAACGVKGDSQNKSFVDTIKTVINIMLFVIGLIAVVMLVIGGIRYATSGGSQDAAKGAKDTILYAIIGIVIAVMAYAVVGFVTQNISDDSSGGIGGVAVTIKD